MNIESLEIKLLKASEIKDGDILLIKIDEKDKSNLTKESIKNMYNQLLKMMNNKKIPMYFFPKTMDINIIKTAIKDNVGNQIDNENIS
jgi:hypothetical protein